MLLSETVLVWSRKDIIVIYIDSVLFIDATYN